MSLYEQVISRRSIRQFKSLPIRRELLLKLVNAARLAPSAANRQPLEYVIVDDEDVKAKLFPCLKWAAYIAPEGDPKPGQEPAAYIVVLVNTKIRQSGFERDVGAAMENMILSAWEEGVGSCWIISLNKEKMRPILDIPSEYSIDSVLALGYPLEDPVVEDMKENVKYWKDETGRLHVPKRTLKDVLHINRF